MGVGSPERLWSIGFAGCGRALWTAMRGDLVVRLAGAIVGRALAGRGRCLGAGWRLGVAPRGVRLGGPSARAAAARRHAGSLPGLAGGGAGPGDWHQFFIV